MTRDKLPHAADLRDHGQAAEARRREPFRNAREAGFPDALLRTISEQLDAHGRDPKLRFVTFARTLDAPAHASEARLCNAVLRAAREHAARLGVWSVYLPRSERATPAVIDLPGLHWLHASGFASRTIMDLYGISATRLFALLRGQPQPRARVRQIRDARGHAEAHAAGLAWLARHRPREVLGAATHGPEHARVARCGHALLQFREHFGRDPRRADDPAAPPHEDPTP